MELALKDAKGALEVSESTFGRDFNEALVHQVVVAFAAGHVKVRAHKRLVLKYVAAVKSHGIRKVQAVLVPVLFVVQSGVLVV